MTSSNAAFESRTRMGAGRRRVKNCSIAAVRLSKPAAPPALANDAMTSGAMNGLATRTSREAASVSSARVLA